MQRYFFDIGFHSQVQHDFTGKSLSSAHEARDMAEMIALDIACVDIDTGAQVEVQVRNSAGRHLFSVPVQKQEIVAA